MSHFKEIDLSGFLYERYVEINNLYRPSILTTVDSVVELYDSFDKQYKQRFFTWTDKGEVTGFARCCEPYWAYKKGHWRLDWVIHPEHKGDNSERKLFQALLRALQPSCPTKLFAHTGEENEERLAILQDTGFKQVMRVPFSMVFTQDFDVEPYLESRRRITGSGIEIKSLAQLMETEPDWMQMLYDLDWEIMQDIPTPEPFTEIGVESFSKMVLMNFKPEGFMLALDGSQWVGISAVKTSQALSHRLETFVTGVVRSHRRRGIATCLKVCVIEWAKERGFTEIRTDNEENNPMYQINMMLGFQPVPGMLTLSKTLEEN